MEPDTADQDATEDVDMIAAPTSDVVDTKSEQPYEAGAVSSGPTKDTQETAKTEEVAVQSTELTSEARPLPESMKDHVKSIHTLVEEQNARPLEEGQQCFLVSRSWLAKVPDLKSPKYNIEDWSSIPLVDNSDIVSEVINDPCVGETVDILKRKFVRLKPGYDLEQFEPFPPGAWELLAKWPGLKDDQIPILRTAHATGENGANVMWEWHPPVLTIYRVWSAVNELPRDKDAVPARLVRSRSTKFQVFLKQAKRVTGIDLSQRVRAWSVLQPPTGETDNTSVSDGNQDSTPSQAWKRLHLAVDSFLALESGSERELIDFGDLTNQQNQKSVKTLGSLGITKDQAIVLDPHKGGNNWTTTQVSSQTRTALPSRNSSANLTVQNRNTKSGRTSPVSHGPLTRGRSQKSGRVPGCVGLANLGNTCYMNAALQCVRSVEELTKYFLSGEWEKELNKDNPLSHNGDVAAAYAHLLKEIYKDSSPGSVSPRQFKATIGRYSTGFSGYGQQDSQEFLGFLLDGLQEDLSRIRKKPYIEKPDSTDEMVNDPDAIRKMAEEVWDITKKRDDSVIADLFTGLYKSTLVCPKCLKVSITFDPFNNLTLPLPLENKWSHTVKFFPLNDRPIDIKVEVDKHASIKSLKEFLSLRTGVPPERLCGAEEWKGRFYKHYTDIACASDEIGGNDNAWFYELEASPTNCSSKPQIHVRSMVDDTPPWDDKRAERLLVPVFHRRPSPGKAGGFHQRQWSACCVPHYIVVTFEEARSEDAIRRKILEKVATFTKHPFFSRSEESEGSDSTEPEIIGLGSDAGSSNEGRIIAQSVKGEDDIVDVRMRDASETNGNTRSNSAVRHQFNHKRPSWVDTGKFLPPDLQNLFDMTIYTEPGTSLPTGMNNVNDGIKYPSLSTRIPLESQSSEDQFDNTTNGTASNEESSSDEASRRSTEQPLTRMNDESEEEEEDATSVIKPIPHRSKQGKQAKPKNKQAYGPKKAHKMYGKGGKKKLRQQQQRQVKERQHNMEPEVSFSTNGTSPDGGPLVRFGEALIVDWSDQAYDSVFSDSASGDSLTTWDTCETLHDPELTRLEAGRARRRKDGISLEACLDEFEREEILSEQDMWYCPRCKEHRRASKKFDLWKTPDILIIHLKRFSSSGFRRDKLEVLVDFPFENLDITTRVLHKEEGKQEIYDLIGVDCHWGGLGGGHYTAHAKNFVNNQWYTYNDSSVHPVSPDKIVDPSAYLLFYRRRSDNALGGPRFQEILNMFNTDSDSDDLPETGEDRRLGEGSSHNGSSSAIIGAGATRQQGKDGGKWVTKSRIMDSASETSDNDWKHGDIRTVDDILAHPTHSVHRSIEEDEGIDLTEGSAQPTGYQILASGWNFDNLLNNDNADLENAPTESAFDAASDIAQVDSSGDERVLSPRNNEFGPELESNYPGRYDFPLQDPPPYSESAGMHSGYRTEMAEDDLDQVWDQKQEVHEVPPEGDTEAQSEAAAEIHLDEDDKLKLG